MHEFALEKSLSFSERSMQFVDWLENNNDAEDWIFSMCDRLSCIAVLWVITIWDLWLIMGDYCWIFVFGLNTPAKKLTKLFKFSGHQCHQKFMYLRGITLK